MPSLVLLIVVTLAVARILVWKYRAFLEFVAITCATIGSFIIGTILTPPHAKGLGMMVSLAALLLSTALVIIIRLFQRAKQSTTSL
jgi:hypothetical protein